MHLQNLAARNHRHTNVPSYFERDSLAESGSHLKADMNAVQVVPLARHDQPGSLLAHLPCASRRTDSDATGAALNVPDGYWPSR